MKTQPKESLIFSDSEEFKTRSPVQDLLLDTIDAVNFRIAKFYASEESKRHDVLPAEMLVMVTANIFANLAFNIIPTSDCSIRIKAFDCINEELQNISKKFFMMLQLHFSDGSKNIN